MKIYIFVGGILSVAGSLLLTHYFGELTKSLEPPQTGGIVYANEDATFIRSHRIKPTGHSKTDDGSSLNVLLVILGFVLLIGGLGCSFYGIHAIKEERLRQRRNADILRHDNRAREENGDTPIDVNMKLALI